MNAQRIPMNINQGFMPRFYLAVEDKGYEGGYRAFIAQDGTQFSGAQYRVDLAIAQGDARHFTSLGGTITHIVEVRAVSIMDPDVGDQYTRKWVIHKTGADTPQSADAGSW